MAPPAGAVKRRKSSVATRSRPRTERSGVVKSPGGPDGSVQSAVLEEEAALRLRPRGDQLVGDAQAPRRCAHVVGARGDRVRPALEEEAVDLEGPDDTADPGPGLQEWTDRPRSRSSCAQASPVSPAHDDRVREASALRGAACVPGRQRVFEKVPLPLWPRALRSLMYLSNTAATFRIRICPIAVRRSSCERRWPSATRASRAPRARGRRSRRSRRRARPRYGACPRDRYTSAQG